METMTALLRIGGNLEMTVQKTGVTPAEAWLLMHIHDPATRDAFEQATLGEPVARSKLDERARLFERYPEQRGLIDHLFPGRTASDVPDSFDELEDTPLELTAQVRQSKRQAAAREQVQDAQADAGDAFVETAPLTPDEVRAQVGASRRKK